MKKCSKKTIHLLLCGLLLTGCLFLTGCDTYQEALNAQNQPVKDEPVVETYFTEIISWSEDGINYIMVYANDTKVKYLICQSGYKYGLTPLFNADGSLQLYKEEPANNQKTN